MTIGSDGTKIPASTLTSVQAQRDLRKSDLDITVKEATLTTSDKLSEQQIVDHQKMYNSTVTDIDDMRSGKVGNLSCVDDKKVKAMFPYSEDQTAVSKATGKNDKDNQEAGEVRDEYSKNFKQARRERAVAQREVNKLGPGKHELSNGDKVEVAVDDKTGHKTVTTTHPDGSTKTVRLDDEKPDSVSVKETDKEGNEKTLDQDGTTVTKGKTDSSGNTVKDKYSIDDKGRPVRETSGPDDDDYKKTTVNPDGSTDDRNKIYTDDKGNPVYEDTHHDGVHPKHSHHHHHTAPVQPGPVKPSPEPLDPGPVNPTTDPDPSDPKTDDIDKVTRKNPADNDESSKLRDDYKKSADEAKKEHDRAAQEADKLGSGHHKLSNGDEVDVTVDDKTGKKTVTTKSPDGTSKKVSIDGNDPESVTVERTNPDGSKETLSEDGQTVTREKTDASGQKTSERFSIDKEGRATRERSGPGADQGDKTTANPDGSSDDGDLVYKDDKGQPIYEVKHHKPSTGKTLS